MQKSRGEQAPHLARRDGRVDLGAPHRQGLAGGDLGGEAGDVGDEEGVRHAAPGRAKAAGPGPVGRGGAGREGERRKERMEEARVWVCVSVCGVCGGGGGACARACVVC